MPMTHPPIHTFAGRRALILHRSGEVRGRVADRLGILGVGAEGRWPALAPEDASADLLIVDVDQGHDGQFPWATGHAPMPSVALVGSESPGRLAWALEQRLDAFLPLTALGHMYSALVLATATFERRVEVARREAETARRAGQRLTLIRAVLQVMRDEEIDEAAALQRLRALAMVERVAVEDAAALLLDERTPRRDRA